MSEKLLEQLEDLEYAEEIGQIQLVGIRLGEEEFAIDVLKITEIIRTVEITIVPRVEPYILGVMNLRGKVVPVIDLRVRFNLENTDFGKTTRIIVVSIDDKEHIGFVVDEVTEVIRIKQSMVEPTPPLVGSVGQEYLLGICKYDSRLITLLDIERIISDSADHHESALKKKMFNLMNKTSSGYAPAPQEAVQKEVIQEAPALSSSSNNKELNHEDEEEAIIETGSADSYVEDNIDVLIAKELALREAETEEINRKKRKNKINPVDVLEDALNQSNAIFQTDASSQIRQNDLDGLINKDISPEIDLSVVNPNIIPQVEIITHPIEEESLVEENQEEKSKETKKSIDKIPSDKTQNKYNPVSVKELKQIASKIISGDYDGSKINENIQGEIGELLRLIVDTKKKVDDIDPLLENSQENLPNVTSMLKDVNHDTEKATIDLMDASDKMANFYKSFTSDIEKLKSLASKDKKDEFLQMYEQVINNLSVAETLGLDIIQTLEFQDITEQKLRKVIKSIEDMGSRIGAIVGFLQISNKSNDEADNSRKQLLADYGLA